MSARGTPSSSLDFMNQMDYLAISEMWTVLTLIYNCKVCLEGSPIANAFALPPPSIEQYLA